MADRQVEKALCMLVAGTKTLRELGMEIRGASDSQRLVQAFMKNSSILSLRTGEDSKLARQLSLVVEANRYIVENELRAQFTSSIEIPQHLSDIVREKLGISNPKKHKFSS